MADDMIRFFKFIATIIVIVTFITLLVISISITHGSELPETHDGPVPVQIVSDMSLVASIHEDFKWTDIFFYAESAPAGFLDREVTVTIQNTGPSQTLFTAPLLSTQEFSIAVAVKPGETRQVYHGSLRALIDAVECPNMTRKRGIGISAFDTLSVDARMQIAFETPQRAGDLEKLSIRSWWHSPGKID